MITAKCLNNLTTRLLQTVRMYIAAGFAQFIEPALIFIVSFIAMYAASVALRFSLFLHNAKISAPPQFGIWCFFLGMNYKPAVICVVSHVPFMLLLPNVWAPPGFPIYDLSQDPQGILYTKLFSSFFFVVCSASTYITYLCSRRKSNFKPRRFELFRYSLDFNKFM